MNFILEFIRLLGRLLGFCLPTISLVNGHAIAGGCMLAFAHDWRIGRSEVGKSNFALNEIEICNNFILIIIKFDSNVSSSWYECCSLAQIESLGIS
jgi:hypothetical protein